MAFRRSQTPPEELAALFLRTVETELPLLETLDPGRAALRPNGPDSWSPKQELGHLIDSAANNHIRFVRTALEMGSQGPGYAQRAWVDIHGYQELPWSFLVGLWHHYNSLLAALVGNLTAAQFSSICTIGDLEPTALDFVIEDYLRHMQHHLDHILVRDVITPYP